jgi:hypothetical protein
MMVNIRKLQSLLKLVQAEGPTNENLKQCVITLANEVIEMSRELERVNATASRAERNNRIGVRRY